MAKNLKLRINPSRITLVLFGITSILVGIHIALLFLLPGFTAAETTGVAGLLNLNSEVSIPTWFAQILFLIASILLFVIGMSGKRYGTYWKSLGAIFVYISIDEGASIHELTAFPLRDLFNIESGFFYYAWVLLFGALFAILVLVYMKFYLNLPRRTKIIFLLSAVLFLIGAIGFEMIGANIASYSSEANLTYSLAVAAEELLEKVGLILFIYGLLDYMKSHKLTFTFK